MHTIFVIFGSTGDLAKRKLFPALSNIYKNKNQTIDIIWVGRRPFEREEFIQYIKQETNEFIEEKSELDNFLQTVNYSQVEINEKDDYLRLKNDIEKLRKPDSQIIFYLSISPEFFWNFIDNYKSIWLNDVKIIFEKPFGSDLASARTLNEKIREVFDEQQVYRIDHYVGKEAVQNIVAFRFANTIFEPIRNNRYIDNIQITGSESIGVGERWGYYDKSWALRDMLQNHLFQMLALIAMDAPSQLDEVGIWQEKLKVFKSIRLGENFLDNVIFGQYKGYHNEKWITSDSRTETFVAAKIEVNSLRFVGVPIYVRTGKYMKKRMTTIVIEFKEVPDILFNKYGHVERNRIVLEVQPNEWINIHFNIKENGSSKEVQRVRSKFIKEVPGKEAYEKLIEDAIVGDKTLFTSRDILEQSWTIVDDIVNCKNNCPIIFTYEKGSDGPDEADALITKDGRKRYNCENI